jgi:hypothetical protein
MDGSQDVIDADRLGKLVRDYRQQLEKKPEDMRLRINLAWCLFMQALHQAGQEALLRSLQENGIIHKEVGMALEAEAQQLLRACLRQTYTVQQLSQRQQEHEEAGRLQSLVKQSGGEHLAQEVERMAMGSLLDLVQEIRRGPNKPKTAPSA